ncbi:hypothetical protein [Chromohalobacter sp.]|uniref:hypothetical protein n=1 Tax=Chromohalobacter sp. TaxID=50740 RepID=UPI001DFFA89D|nr:hypothetical protein [Chromohalobacter sp.]NQY47207.1 ATP-binding protein [Chromohalobacter sp.]
MSHSNGFISFLRHYGPIPAGDNMYDELIQAEIERYGIDPVIHITPARLQEVQENFGSIEPRNVILTGTAGDGKTFHCRQIWTAFGSDLEHWNAGEKIVFLTLPASGKTLTIVKDLSELTQDEKNKMLANLAASVAGKDPENVYLVAANDGQLLASWRDWSERLGEDEHEIFKIVEDMLVEERTRDDVLHLNLYNLSRLDASEHFQELVEQVVEHPQWSQCDGCEMLKSDGSTTCPIRINRERLRNGNEGSVFRKRLGELMKLARASRMHIPIRDLLLLGVNILLGDRQSGRILLTCRTAKNRADKEDYHLTNPYTNVFGMNLSGRQRQQYQVFNILEAFGIGRETNNKFDNLLIYGAYSDSNIYTDLVSSDAYYGAPAYEPYLRDYLEGARENIEEFIQALSRQRQGLFFSLPAESTLDPWHLTVYKESGKFLEFVEGLKSGGDTSQTTELLVRGLNRTFCGMMIDDGTELYLASSGGDGRGRVASLLNYYLPTTRNKRSPYLNFALGADDATPCMQIVDPTADGNGIVDSLALQLTHFEYLIRVASGSLPASFSRQCNEDFLDFKLRLIKRLDDLIGEEPFGDEISLQTITVDEYGRAHRDNIRIRVSS